MIGPGQALEAADGAIAWVADGWRRMTGRVAVTVVPSADDRRQFQLSTEELDALAHAGEAKAGGGRGLIEAAPVVADGDVDLSVLLDHRHRRARRRAVLSWRW